MTNEESTERYVLEIGKATVFIVDEPSGATVSTFTGPDRLLAATAELNRLNAAAETSPESEPWTPAEFLSKELPAVARRQRIEGHLAEVREIEESLARVLAEDAINLKRATALREKLEKELSSPFSSTQTAQNADLVGQDTPEPFSFVERLQAPQREQSKPGPY